MGKSRPVEWGYRKSLLEATFGVFCEFSGSSAGFINFGRLQSHKGPVIYLQFIEFLGPFCGHFMSKVDDFLIILAGFSINFVIIFINFVTFLINLVTFFIDFVIILNHFKVIILLYFLLGFFRSIF